MDYIYAFVTGGAICVVGQLLMDATRLTAPRVLVLLVCAGAVLQAFGLYEYLVRFAGTGARVPLPGFGYNLVKGAVEGAEKGLFEAVTGGLKAAAGDNRSDRLGISYRCDIQPQVGKMIYLKKRSAHQRRIYLIQNSD